MPTRTQDSGGEARRMLVICRRLRSKTASLRASVGSTEASASLVARVGVVGPTRAKTLRNLVERGGTAAGLVQIQPPRFVANSNPRDVRRAQAIPLPYVTHSVAEAVALG